MENYDANGKDGIINNPHDAAFKSAFQKKEIAKAFFKSCFSLSISEKIDFEAMEMVNKSYVDEHLREKHSDIVYKTRIKDGDGFLYILLEHQSSPDPLMAFRLLCYMVNLWKGYFDANPGQRQLPVILPIVLYNGKAKWSAPVNFKDLFDNDFSGFIPDFIYKLYDLSVYDDRQFLGGAVTLKIVLHMMKHIFDENLDAVFRSLMDIISGLTDSSTFLEFLEWALRYTYHAREESETELTRIIEQGSSRIQDKRIRGTAMTIAERIRQKGFEQGIVHGMEQGMQQGMQQGIRQGLLEGIEIILSLKFGNEGLKMLSEIYKIDNIGLLKAINQALKTVSTMDELRNIYN